MDLGRLPEARYPGREIVLSHQEVTEDDLLYVLQEEPSEELREKVTEAARRCPKQAITVEG